MLESQTSRYSVLQIGLHWIIALLVLFQLFFGEAMTHFVDAREEGAALAPSDLFQANIHYWVGLSILGLAVLRLIVRFREGAPPPPAAISGVLRIASRATHWLFYGLLVIVPVTGLLGYYVGGAFGDIHSYAKPVFIGLILLHGAAALFHHFWLRDGLLIRMLKPASSGK